MSDYNNKVPLTIPAFINCLTKEFTPTERMHLAYLYALTRKGYQSIDFLSGEQSRVLGKGVRKADVRKNIKLFVKKGYIQTEHNPVSRNEEDMLLITWVYNVGAEKQDENSAVKPIF